MTKKQFDDFITRLAYWNRGDGTNEHITNKPIFEVQELYKPENGSPRWEPLTYHFTKESAEKFMKARPYAYGDMRIYTNSQHDVPEFNMIIDALLDGDITFNEHKVLASNVN